MKFFTKIIELEKVVVEKVLKKPTYLKGLSLLIALTMFVLLNGLGSLSFGNVFDTTEYVDGIQLRVLYDENKIVTGLPETIGVNVTGSDSNVTRFKANISNIVATLNLTGRDDADYKVESSEFEFSNVSKDVTVTPVVKGYNVTIDTLTEVIEPVEVEYINSDLEEPLILSDPIIDQPNVRIPIGINNKENLSSVKVLIDLSKINTSQNGNVFDYEEQVKVYDKEGNILNTYTELPTVKVTQPYEINSVTLPVKYQIINNNTEKYISSICKVEEGNDNCLNEVKVYGNQEELEKLDYITYVVDLDSFDEEQGVVDVKRLLQYGVYVQGDDNYQVSIQLEEGVTQKLENLPVIVRNLDPSLEVSNIDNINIDVTLTGAKSTIDNMTANDLTLYIDASEITKPVNTEMNIQTNIDNTISYELSTTTINVEFKEK